MNLMPLKQNRIFGKTKIFCAFPIVKYPLSDVDMPTKSLETDVSANIDTVPITIEFSSVE